MGINLTKGQKISLEKEAGGKLTTVLMGLGWDVAKSGGFLGFGGGGSIDLDASCVMFDASGTMTDAVWFRQLQSKDGSITHKGDNRTGAGEGDDEQILVNLQTVPANVKSLVFVVNSFTGQTFDKVENAFCRIVDDKNTEVARYQLNGKGSHTAQIMAKLYRHNDEWKMHAIGEFANGRTFQDLVPTIKQSL
ncbi:MAG: TerD family protein [Pyrinomonadaceae bacterium]|nr:TerD family protein [Pyrinomonadaceae bacterium]